MPSKERMTVEQLTRRIEDLEQELNELKRERTHVRYSFMKVSDETARELLEGQLARTDAPSISVFETSQALGLPADQVERIFDEFVKQGKLTDGWD